MRRTWILAAAIAAALAASASAWPSRIIPVVPHGHRAAVSARVGDVVVLRLRANASTGYAWYVTSGTSGGIVRLRSTEYLPGNTSLLGAPGTYVARLEARRTGRVPVRLVYRRTTTPPSPPVNMFTLVVTVH